MTWTGIFKVRLPANSGLPRDDTDMDLVFQRTVDPTSTDFDNARDDIKAFFHTPATASSKLENYMVGDRDYATNHAKIDVYHVPAARTRFLGSPVATRSWTLSGPADGKNLPEQVAVCLSFHGDLTDVPEKDGATRPAARRRGRIYFGPLNTNALEVTASPSTSPQTPAASLLHDLGQSAKEQLGTAMAGHGWTWVVFSRASWTVVPVIGGYVDDRFDTQRRRLERTSGRVAYVL